MTPTKIRPTPEPIRIELAADGDVTVTVPPDYPYWRLELAHKRLGEAAEQIQQACAAAHKKATAALREHEVALGLLPPTKGR